MFEGDIKLNIKPLINKIDIHNLGGVSSKLVILSEGQHGPNELFNF